MGFGWFLVGEVPHVALVVCGEQAARGAADHLRALGDGPAAGAVCGQDFCGGAVVEPCALTGGVEVTAFGVSVVALSDAAGVAVGPVPARRLGIGPSTRRGAVEEYLAGARSRNGCRSMRVASMRERVSPREHRNLSSGLHARGNVRIAKWINSAV